jgi:alpha-1,2-mannosyltransferase
VGLAVSVKPVLAVIVLWWVARRCWRAAGAAAGAVLTAVAIGVVAYGLPAYAEWLRNLSSISWSWAASNASVWAPPARAWADSHGVFTPFALNSSLSTGIGLTAGVLVVATAVRGLAARRDDMEASWALLVATSLLAFPLGWVYYAWWLAPFALLVRVPSWSWLALPLLLPPAWLLALSSSGSAVAAVSWGSCFTWGALVWWAGLLRSRSILHPS